ncbi:SseB family protein [Streptomyces pseudovenezuelae]|uniref:SseB family protein n=1 Tax=Streptomyces pseudovenezuelae TaxID=67350 RepID=UPI002E817A91|nr:SseB family protein [Streptomyces pseudovenezuelae]WUA91367.1 SseB family protein [Streptomyces pseudovenezuelae]
MSDTGEGNREELLPEVREAFLRGRWYLQKPERPGVMVLGGPGEGGAAVPIFSSLVQLARYAGAVKWFSTFGNDLLPLLPTGLGLAVDLASPQPQLLRAEQVDSLRAALTVPADQETAGE